ncbi:hypothetical protein ACFQYP_05105 [Nonomuraea antimicrobica]
MLDVLVYENILLAWQRMPLGDYLIVSHEGEEIRLTAQQADLWTRGPSRSTSRWWTNAASAPASPAIPPQLIRILEGR